MGKFRLFPIAPTARRRRIKIYVGLFLGAYWALPLYQFVGKDIVDFVLKRDTERK